MAKELYELSLEISSISLMLTSISNTLEPGCTRLTDESLSMVLWGASNHLDRIAKDLNVIDGSNLRGATNTDLAVEGQIQR